MPTKKSKKFLAEPRVYEPGDPVVSIEQTTHHFPGSMSADRTEGDPPEDIASPPVLTLELPPTGFGVKVRVTPDLARTLVSVLLDHLWDSTDPAPYAADVTERVHIEHVRVVRELLGPVLAPPGAGDDRGPLRDGTEVEF